MSTERDPEWREQLQRGKLDPASLADLRRELAARPHEAELLEEEIALEEAMGRLPKAGIPSNFTARVLQAIDREAQPTHRRAAGILNWWRSVAWARQTVSATIVAAVMLSVWHLRVQRRAELARNVADVAQATSAGDLAVESLKDFDAIQLLRVTARPDDVELLTALSQ